MFSRKIQEANPLSSTKSIGSLKRASKLTIDVFHKTKNDLETINGQLTVEAEARRVEILKLQEEINTIDAQTTKNAKIASNIDKILGE